MDIDLDKLEQALSNDAAGRWMEQEALIEKAARQFLNQQCSSGQRVKRCGNCNGIGGILFSRCKDCEGSGCPVLEQQKAPDRTEALDNMPDELWAWRPDILQGEFTASSKRKDKPAVKYIRALSARALPQGWKLVPLEPTQDMRLAALRLPLGPFNQQPWPDDYYKAMLSASPPVPVED